MPMQVWENRDTRELLLLRPESNSHHYLEYRNKTYFISGVTLYWLLSNNWEKK